MPATALAADAIAPIPIKERALSKKMSKALHLLETGQCSTQRAAAERAGISEYHLSRRLKEPQIQAFIARKRAENIAIGSLRASRRFVDLIDAESEHVAAKVAERILTSEGVLRSDSNQVSVNVGVSVGYIVDLTGSHHSSSDAPLTQTTIDHE